MADILTPREKLLKQFGQDFSTMTVEELRAKYRAIPRDVEAFDKVEIEVAKVAGREPVSFEERLKTHNPIYYLAERVFFDNTAKMREEEKQQFLYPPLHRDILCKEMLDYVTTPTQETVMCFNSGLLILIQRDSFKSTFTHGVLPLFLALRDKHLYGRNARILLVHYKEMQVSAAVTFLKDKARFNPWLREVWPEFCSDSDFGTKTLFDWPYIKNSPARERSIYGMGITGDATGWHFDYAIFDDLVTKEHIKSKPVREDVALRHDALMYTLDITRGKCVYSGTRYHIQDLWGKMLKADVAGKPMYRAVVIAAGEKKDGKWVNLSHPYRHTPAKLEWIRQKEMSVSGNDFLFHLQMLNQPKATGLTAASSAWYQRCQLKHLGPGWRAITCDPAWKGTKNAGEGDYASIQVWHFERRGSMVIKFLLDGTHSNELTDFVGRNEIFRLMRKYQVRDVAVEERGGKSYQTTLLAEAATRGLNINFIELKASQVAKAQRIATFLGDVQARRVFIVEGCDPLLERAILGETDDFPQTDHDDALDAAAQTNDPAVKEGYFPEEDDSTYATPPWATRATAEPDPEPRTRYGIS